MNRDKTSIDKTPLGKKAADIIRQRIIKGVYNQGSRLIEEELAGEFEISRVCIRDAFLILESEGMVKREHNKYTKVLKLKPKDIEDLFRLRLALELLSIETCINNNRFPSEKLKHCLKELEKNSINSLEYVETDLNFHETIIATAQNSYVINVYKSIKYQLMTLLFSLYNMFQEDFSVKGSRQHHKIVEFLEKGDLDNAQDFIKEHIKNNLDYVIKLSEQAK